MRTSSIVVDKAQELAAAGRHTDVIAYLGAREPTELEESPDLALLYGTAYARVGRHDEGRRWLEVALDTARMRNEHAIEGSALNARGGVAQGELGLARRTLDEVRAIRSRVPDPADEAEDQRALALVLTAEGELVAAEHALRDVMVRAEGHRRPQLLAEATRDLAIVLRRAGRNAEAQAAARSAQAIFARLGAEAEIRNLASQEWGDDFGAELGRSLAPLHAAQALADAGDYAELITYLGGRTQDELEQSPMLALLCGIGHSRLGRLDVGQQWAMVALSRARVLGDRTLEVRGLNVCGAIALERGGISEATSFFTRAQEEAMQDNDMATLGRCANNLGIIANMQGDFGRAVGAYTRAIAAYQKARNERGIAETQHNLGIAYREQGRLDDAMHATDTAMREAERLGDRRLKAQALAGRAEIQVARGDPELAIREAQRAVVIHRDLKDAVRETEDLRILAVALGAAGRKREADAMFREVIARAAKHERPLLVAIAQRDLADLLAREGNIAAAREVAETARATLERLGAKAEAEKLDALLNAPRLEPSSSSSPRRSESSALEAPPPGA